ncbi:pyridoxine/pyridoxal/pyridoxamine kinase [Alcaligenes phenolicus]|uniref:pyridoxine/pyridoxal/pyridoxamine kinase n=1 Tax=Alcaligenes phenolicus TaxID=232846 RepID=UPI002AA79530|nr:pyridoxine/pyridoxal/pyridoxamine kinase [Alcaligenes phenolicus]
MNTAAVTFVDRERHPYHVDVVSIQSQVVYGRVGNNVAGPTLRRHGFKVAAVPTVLLSNNPQYPTVHGGAVPDEWLEGFLNDLVLRGALDKVRAVLIGYLGSANQAVIIANWLKALLQDHPDTLVIVDPVIGDLDVGVYVDPALIPAYHETLLPLATGLTPNNYELSLLSQQPCDTIQGSSSAAHALLNGRTEWVIATSAAPDSWQDGQIKLLMSRKEPRADTLLSHPRVDCAAKGTGDLFASTLLAHLILGADLHSAVHTASASVLHQLELTRQAGHQELILPIDPFRA